MKTLRLILMLMLFVAPAFAAHKVSLTWTGSVVDATHPAPDHYKVYRSLVSGSGYVLMGIVPSTQLSFINGSNPDGTPLVEGQMYCYVVRAALAGSSDSGNSNEACVVIPVTPAPPTNVTAVPSL